MGSKTLCSQCGDEFANITLHWNLSSDCDYPPFTDRQREIIEGVLLSRGTLSINPRSGTYPYLKIRTINKKLLNWIQTELGALANDVLVEMDAEAAKSAFERFSPNNEYDIGEVNERYSLQTCNHPDLERYYREWTNDGVRTVPNSVSPSPLKLRVLYAFNGSLQTYNSRNAVHFSLTNTNPPDSVLTELFDGFGPIRISSEQGLVVRLCNCKKFYDYIGEPISGAESRWPDNPGQLEEPPRICPSCGGRFTSLGTHWTGDNTFCEIPRLTGRQLETIYGMLLSGGWSSGKQESNHANWASVTMPTSKQAVVDYVEDLLDWMHGTTRVANTSKEVSENLEKRFGKRPRSHDLPNPSQLVTTVFHPELVRIQEHSQEDREGLFDSIPPAPITDKILYMARGWQPESGVYIGLSGRPISDEGIYTHFEDFDPTVTYSKTGSRKVYISKSEKFFDFIGEPPSQQIAHKWPENWQTK